MIRVYLQGRVADQRVSADNVSLTSRGQNNPVGVPASDVLLNDVSLGRTEETDAKVTPLGCIAISKKPVPTEPVTAGAAV